MNCLSESRELVLDGQLKKGLKKLLTCVEENFSNKLAEVQELIARFSDLRMEYMEEQITDEQFRVGKSRIRKPVLALLDLLESGGVEEKANNDTKIQLRAFHKHTCDRAEQQNEFLSYFEGKNQKKLHFYFVTGEEEQSHFGFVNRIAYDRGGYLLDIDNPNLQTCKILIEEIVLESYSSPENLKKDFLRKFMANANVPVNTYEPILEKKIDFVCKNSPVIKKLKETDYVCFLVSMYEDEWNEDQSPQLIKWFIEDFCKATLGANVPTFLFFFGIIYDEGSQAVKDSVAKVIKSSELIKNGTINPLPELGKVGKNHINSWFRKYKIIAPNKQTRTELISKYFGEEEEFDMETIEIELKKIIDAFNKNA